MMYCKLTTSKINNKTPMYLFVMIAPRTSLGGWFSAVVRQIYSAILVAIAASMSSSSDVDRRNRYGYRSDCSGLERVNSDGHSSIYSAWSSCRSPISTTPTLWQPDEWNIWIARRAALRQKAKEASRRVEDQVIGPVYERIMGSLCDFPQKAAQACGLSLLKMILMWGYFTYNKALNPKHPKSGGDQMVRQLSQIGYPLRDDKEVRVFLKRLRRRVRNP